MERRNACMEDLRYRLGIGENVMIIFGRSTPACRKPSKKPSPNPASAVSERRRRERRKSSPSLRMRARGTGQRSVGTALPTPRQTCRRHVVAQPSRQCGVPDFLFAPAAMTVVDRNSLRAPRDHERRGLCSRRCANRRRPDKGWRRVETYDVNRSRDLTSGMFLPYFAVLRTE